MDGTKTHTATPKAPAPSPTATAWPKLTLGPAGYDDLLPDMVRMLLSMEASTRLREVATIDQKDVL